MHSTSILIFLTLLTVRFAPRRFISLQPKGGIKEGDRTQDRAANNEGTASPTIATANNNTHNNNGNRDGNNSDNNLDLREHRPVIEDQVKLPTDTCPYNTQFIQLPKGPRARINGKYRDLEIMINYSCDEMFDEYRNGNPRRKFIDRWQENIELHDLCQRSQALKIINVAVEKAKEEYRKAGKVLDGRDVKFVRIKSLHQCMTVGLFFKLLCWNRPSWRQYRRWFSCLCVICCLLWKPSPERYYPATAVEAVLNGTAKYYGLGTAVLGSIKEQNIVEVGEVCLGERVCDIEGNGMILHARHPTMGGR